MIILYINNALVDLRSGTKIAITIQGFDIGNISTRNITYTNSISLPATENNKRVFGYSHKTITNSNTAYQKLPARLILNGIEVKSIKYFILDEYEFGEFKGTLYDDGVNFFDLIRDKIASDCRHLTGGAWNASDIDTARAATSNVISPVVNWGRYNGTTNEINNTFYLPSYFYHELISAILEDTGYSISGAILSDSDLTDLILPFARPSFLYSQSYQDERTFKGTHTSIQTILGLSAETVVRIDEEISDPIGWFDFTTNYRYTIPNFSSTGDIGSITLTTTITINMFGQAIGNSYRIIIKKNGSTNLGTYLYTATTTSPEEITLTISSGGNFQDSDYFDLRIVNVSGSGFNVSVNDVQFSGSVSRTPNRNFLFHSYLLPDQPQEDYIRDFVMRFGALLKFKFNTIQIKTIQEIIEDKANSVDWTSKRVRDLERIEFKNESYAQNNYFNYEQDEGVSNNLGQGNFELTSKTVQEEKEIFATAFLNTESAPIAENATMNMAQIPVYDISSASIDDVVQDPRLRILTIRAKSSSEPDVVFNVIGRSDYKVGYFVDSLQAKDTGFQYFVDTNYVGLGNALNKTKLVSRYYNLDSKDIANADIFLPIFDNGEYFILNRIVNYIDGKVTRVELLKVL